MLFSFLVEFKSLRSQYGDIDQGKGIVVCEINLISQIESVRLLS